MDPEIWIGVGILVVVVFAVEFFRKPRSGPDETDYDTRHLGSSGSDWDSSGSGSDSGDSGACDSSDSGDSGCSDGGGGDD
jgi:hypothetical protein